MAGCDLTPVQYAWETWPPPTHAPAISSIVPWPKVNTRISRIVLHWSCVCKYSMPQISRLYCPLLAGWLRVVPLSVLQVSFICVLWRRDGGSDLSVLLPSLYQPFASFSALWWMIQRTSSSDFVLRRLCAFWLRVLLSSLMFHTISCTFRCNRMTERLRDFQFRPTDKKTSGWRRGSVSYLAYVVSNAEPPIPYNALDRSTVFLPGKVLEQNPLLFAVFFCYVPIFLFFLDNRSLTHSWHVWCVRRCGTWFPVAETWPSRTLRWFPISTLWRTSSSMCRQPARARRSCRGSGESSGVKVEGSLIPLHALLLNFLRGSIRPKLSWAEPSFRSQLRKVCMLESIFWKLKYLEAGILHAKYVGLLAFLIIYTSWKYIL